MFLEQRRSGRLEQCHEPRAGLIYSSAPVRAIRHSSFDRNSSIRHPRGRRVGRPTQPEFERETDPAAWLGAILRTFPTDDRWAARASDMFMPVVVSRRRISGAKCAEQTEKVVSSYLVENAHLPPFDRLIRWRLKTSWFEKNVLEACIANGLGCPRRDEDRPFVRRVEEIGAVPFSRIEIVAQRIEPA